MIKTITRLFFTILIAFSVRNVSAQCNITATLNAVPDSLGSYSYTITGSWQNASPSATSYITISPGPTFYGQSSVNYQFPFGGTFTICMTVSDSMNTCSHTVCDTVVVGGSNSCGAFIQAVNNGGGSFTFTGTPNTPNGWNTSYTWSFGDGTSSNQNPATHAYASNGTYTVCLSTTATDPANSSNTCSGSSCYVVNVQGNSNGGGSLTCNIGFYAYFNSGSGSFSFVNTSYTSDSSAVPYYSWQIDGVQFSNLANPSYVATDTLPHYVCLSQMYYNAATGDSCYSTYCDSIQPAANGGGGNPGTCQAGFVLWQDSLNPTIYYGYNTSTGSGSTAYIWDFGDGTTGTGPYPTHIYASTGSYNVCLTVIDSANNCTSTYCDSAGVFKMMNPGMSQVIILPNLATGVSLPTIDFSAVVAPNPINENSLIKMSSPVSRYISVQLTDLSGRLLYSETSYLTKGNNSIALPVQEINSGVYFVRLLENSNIIRTIRVVK